VVRKGFLSRKGDIVQARRGVPVGVAVFVGLGRSFVKVQADDPPTAESDQAKGIVG